jgi:hypothetical protein
MSTSDADTAAWAREHRACYELQPLVERHGGSKIQVGFTLTLYAALPMEKGPGPERREAGRQIWEKLREVVESLAPPADSRARAEIEPPRTAAFLRPENQMQPEIGLTARVFHGDDYFAPVTGEERNKLAGAEQKLASLGLKRGHW